MSGGVSICVAAVDKRTKAVIIQGLFVSGEQVGEKTKAYNLCYLRIERRLKRGRRE
jgi:hypothetical protein